MEKLIIDNRTDLPMMETGKNIHLQREKKDE